MSAIARAVVAALAALCLLTSAQPSESQRRARRSAAPRRVIVLDELDCEMGRWRTPMLVPVLTMPACPEDALLAACGATPTPRAACEELAPADVEALAQCPPGRETFLALLRVAERAGIPTWLDPLLSRFEGEGGLDEVQRALLADLLRRRGRYEDALARFVSLADDARDPALRALALERVVEIVEHDDWNDDGATDDDLDFAAHFAPPRLPDRPWAREVAVRALPRVGCLHAHAVALGAIRRRFDFDPEGVIALDHAQTLTGDALRDHLVESLARCRAERAPCAERVLDHAQDEARRGLHACGRLDRGAEPHHAAYCREGLALATWLATERPLPTLGPEIAAASARLAWWSSAGSSRRRTPPPDVTIATPSARAAVYDASGAFDPFVARRQLERLPIASCPPPDEAVLAVIEIDEAGDVRVGSTARSACLRSALASLPRVVPGAEGGTWWGTAVLVFPER